MVLNVMRRVSISFLISPGLFSLPKIASSCLFLLPVFLATAPLSFSKCLSILPCHFSVEPPRSSSLINNSSRSFWSSITSPVPSRPNFYQYQENLMPIVISPSLGSISISRRVIVILQTFIENAITVPPFNRMPFRRHSLPRRSGKPDTPSLILPFPSHRLAPCIGTHPGASLSRLRP